MAHKPRLEKKVAHSILSDKSQKVALTHQEVLDEAMT